MVRIEPDETALVAAEKRPHAGGINDPVTHFAVKQ